MQKLEYVDELEDAMQGVTYCRDGRCMCVRFRLATLESNDCECGHRATRHNAHGAIAFGMVAEVDRVGREN